MPLKRRVLCLFFCAGDRSDYDVRQFFKKFSERNPKKIWEKKKIQNKIPNNEKLSENFDKKLLFGNESFDWLDTFYEIILTIQLSFEGSRETIL